MSTSTQPSAPSPNTSSPGLNPTDSERFDGILPPDPLLQSGCFIDPTASNGETLTDGPSKSNTNGAKPAPPIQGRSSDRPVRGSSLSGTPKSSSNGGDSAAAATGESAGDGSEDSKSKRRRRAAGETPDWLPPGWYVEDRVRSSGATAGLIDKYYCDPVSGHVFRSKKEVLYFLENGIKRKKGESSNIDTTTGESPGSHKQHKASPAVKAPPKFNFNDPPESVTWVLTDHDQDSWSPFVDDKKVPDPTTREWAAAFKFVSAKRR